MVVAKYAQTPELVIVVQITDVEESMVVVTVIAAVIVIVKQRLEIVTYLLEIALQQKMELFTPLVIVRLLAPHRQKKNKRVINKINDPLSNSLGFEF
jgi:hypothetical protein